MTRIAGQLLNLKCTKTAVIFVSILLGLIDAWAFRYRMNVDGISYLDMGDDFLRGDLWSFVNAHWSPAYPILLGTAVKLSGASIKSEFPIVHAVNFLVYMYAVGSAWLFVGQLVRLRCRYIVSSTTVDHRTTVAASRECALVWLIFMLFWWAALRHIGLSLVTPDMLLGATIIICLAIVLRLWDGGTPGYGWCIILGLCTGFGYLCKAVLLPLIPVFVLSAAFKPGIASLWSSAKRAVLVIAAFLAVTSPWMACLQYKYGIMTFSESGHLNILWHVNRTVPYPDWQGYRPKSGSLSHPIRVVLRDPVVYEFAQPVRGTYPPWKDPAYWLAGVEAPLDLMGHLRQLKAATLVLAKELTQGFHGFFLSLFLACVFMRFYREGGQVTVGSLYNAGRIIWPVFLFAAAGLSMFALILTGMRYIGVFIFLMFAAVLWSITLHWELRPNEWPGILLLTIATAFFMTFLPGLLLNLKVGIAAAQFDSQEPQLSETYQQSVATELLQLGLVPETPIAIIGGSSFNQFWARLCRARIVAEVPRSEVFLLQQPGNLNRVLNVFRDAGARFTVILEAKSLSECLGREVAKTGIRLLDLRRSGSIP